MKLSDHVDEIRKIIDSAFRNRLGRMGITASSVQPIESIPHEYELDRKRIDSIHQVLLAETGKATDAYEKLIEEFTFTLFNRVAALKVMEAHGLHAEIVTRRSMHGDRSFAHKDWLENNPEGRNEEMEGLVHFMEHQLSELAADIPLFSPQNPFHLLPTAIELNGILLAFNKIESDPQVETDIWHSDDVLGWLYESYNNEKKRKHKEDGGKTEYDKVSLQSQVYTPRWVVKFLVDNSLGKLYLEMFPDSEIKDRYKIANAPKNQTRSPKPLTEIKLIDPAPGSGNFLLYAFDLFYDMYKDQVDNYGADYNEKNIPELIIAHNLHGIDIDDRAIQLTQLGLYIKAKRKKRSVKIEHFNIVSSDFFLPEYKQVQSMFEASSNLDVREKKIISELWDDLLNAYKFGSLIRLEEKLSLRWFGTKKMVDQNQISLYDKSDIDDFTSFKNHFFTQLQKVVNQNTVHQGLTFLNTKTQDAITFLQLLTQKYDIAVANPPYTDSADFGPTLKKFVDTNYRTPYKFNTNLYAAFIKRCCELINENGFVALIHPHTFMFIKTFEDVRKYIIEHTHIDILVDYGLDRVNLFGTGILLDATWYVLSKKQNVTDGLYFNISANQQERAKQFSLNVAYDDVLNKRRNERVYSLSQIKLKIIEGWPFIYWISDGFREKFQRKSIGQIADVAEGCKTANNFKYLRFWWEKSSEFKLNKDWPLYSKGGPYRKWQGNLWLIINWLNDGKELKSDDRAAANNEIFYFKEGITFTGAGSKGTSFRYLPEGSIFDTGSRSIFSKDEIPTNYFLGLLNSSLSLYTIECLNPTVNTTVGDIKRIPFVKPLQLQEDDISSLAKENVEIKKNLSSYQVIETNYKKSPLVAFSETTLKFRLLAYLNHENEQLTKVLLNETVINQLIFKVYELSYEDRQQVENKMGKPIGELPIIDAARKAYLEASPLLQSITIKHINNLATIDFDEQKAHSIKLEFGTLYQSNNNLEEFCIRNQINPINVWYWYKEIKVLPQARAAEITMEFLANAFRNILMKDEDGIVPLVGLPGEPKLMDRLEEYCFKEGFSSAQFMQLDGLIGHPINEYIEHYFFKNFSDHLNLFMYLPKTPFIWHLSSGEHQGFEAYIIIYKWNSDSLYKLKSSYLSKRKESLNYRKQQVEDNTSAQAQTEKETIRLQLQEIEIFEAKIDALITEGYDPKLDDGVAKNIAPLQKKGMLRAEVLKSVGANSQLQKYLNADW